MPTPRQDLAAHCRGSAQPCSCRAQNSSSFPGVSPRAACAHLVLPVTVITALLLMVLSRLGLKSLSCSQIDVSIYISGFPWPLSSTDTPQRARSIPAWSLQGAAPRKTEMSLSEVSSGESCSAVSTSSPQGPSGLSNGKCCPFKKPGPGLRQKHCLLNYHVQKQWPCQVSLYDCFLLDLRAAMVRAET